MGIINRPGVKSAARDFIRGGRRSVLGLSTVYIAILLLLNGIDALFYYITDGDSLSMFVTVLVGLMSTILSAGYTLFCMGIVRGEETPFSVLFDGFANTGRVIWLTVLMGLKIFLWSMLFWIPGIVAAYRYRFALYNLLENPELSASQAIALSGIQTNGMKAQLFWLDLSFIGWIFLTVVTAGVAWVYLTPYMQLADLGYYEAGKRVISPFPSRFSEDGEQF